ncbi:MAG: SEC-C domain-containing protein, partial [Clostridia bacterium]|nr:SEC-C domain-containing protein [Clostridia bacterium]
SGAISRASGVASECEQYYCEQYYIIIVSDNARNAHSARAFRSRSKTNPCPCGSGKKFKNCCGRNA